MLSRFDALDVFLMMAGLVLGIGLVTALSDVLGLEALIEPIALLGLVALPWLRRRLFGAPPPRMLKTGAGWAAVTVCGMLLAFVSAGVLVFSVPNALKVIATTPDMTQKAETYLKEYPPFKLPSFGGKAKSADELRRAHMQKAIATLEKRWEKQRERDVESGLKGTVLGCIACGISIFLLRLRIKRPAFT
jgi:hypothetical protein